MKKMFESTWQRRNFIGKGSFGSVHLAVHKSNSQPFAVKSVDQNNCSVAQIESIENEINILRSLSSPYIVNYLGDDVTTESLAKYRNLHMEYMPGGNVSDSTNGFDVNEAIVSSYTMCILKALKYLHEKSIVHCDVKSTNILIGHVKGTCKLADFGSAMKLPDYKKQKTPAISRGSPLWMAPEVVRQEYQGPESDIWSLGCTVIEMISGKPAWKDDGVRTLFRIGYSDDQPEFPARLSETGRDFVSRCLIRERNERWSCDQLLQHPFVSNLSLVKVIESSPRCVLDFSNSEFNDDYDDRDHYDGDNVTEITSNSIRRILELASSVEAVWELENWTVVRDGDKGGEGTRWEY